MLGHADVDAPRPALLVLTGREVLGRRFGDIGLVLGRGVRRGQGHDEPGLAAAEPKLHRARSQVDRDLLHGRGDRVLQGEADRGVQRRGQPPGEFEGLVATRSGGRLELFVDRFDVRVEFHGSTMASFWHRVNANLSHRCVAPPSDAGCTTVSATMHADEIRFLFAYDRWATLRVLDVLEGVDRAVWARTDVVGEWGLGAILVHHLGASQRWRHAFQDSGERPRTGTRAAAVDRRPARALGRRMGRRSMPGWPTITDGFVAHVHEGVPVWQMLVHVVNHGTQHRAEAAALLTAEGRSPGELDLFDYAEEQESTRPDPSRTRSRRSIEPWPTTSTSPPGSGALIEGEADLTEKKMFGGLAFLIGGNMAVAASGQGGLLVRADPETSETLLASKGVQPMEMRGRQMQGWLRVDDDAVRTKRQLERWVRVGVGYARTLPAKG